MLQRIRDRRSDGEGGFTLIELLVVIIILGILAAVVVFAVGGIGDKGQRSACKIDTRTLRTAEEAYSAQATPNGGGGAYTADETVLVNKGFLSEVSSLHDIVLAGTSFNITVQKSPECGVLGGITGTDGAAPGAPPADPAKPQNV